MTTQLILSEHDFTRQQTVLESPLRQENKAEQHAHIGKERKLQTQFVQCQSAVWLHQNTGSWRLCGNEIELSPTERREKVDPHGLPGS